MSKADLILELKLAVLLYMNRIHSGRSTERQICYSFGLVCCGLMSHSAIFQLYGDGTVVKFPNLNLLPST